MDRRQFVTTSIAAIAGPVMAKGNSMKTHQADKLTIQQVIDSIKSGIPFSGSSTVDTVKSGDPAQPVRAIVTTMFATVEVIRKAIELDANFIIAHEPTFYNHADETQWLEGSSVFVKKMELLKKHNIVVWRFHDYIHSNNPDGVFAGVLAALGWQSYTDGKRESLINLPPTALKNLITHLKTRLNIPTVRFIGDPNQLCSKIALLPGAPGGRVQINFVNQTNPDVLVCGELQEWETSEYFRDGRLLGINRSLIVLGHSVSEEPGMEWLVSWLQPKVGEIRITHVPSNNPFQWA
jgi:putative NIF3 family GTP cyclohydrolase 1 type 2